MRIEATSAATASVHQVEARRTAATPAQLRAAIGRAYQRAVGRPASGATLDVLQAQASLETASGSQMFNYNFGGIKGASPRGESASYGTHEVLGGHDVHLQQSFRSYQSLDEGASDYIAVLNQRFPVAFGRARAGDMDGFAHALKQEHYFTADEHQYAAGLHALAGGASSAMSPSSIASSDPQDYSTTDEIARLLDVVSSSAARIAAPESDES